MEFKNVTKYDVLIAFSKALKQNKNTTSLEVKEALRADGFWAIQSEISKKLQEIADDFGITFTVETISKTLYPEDVEVKSVTSSTVKAIGYNPKSTLLFVEFMSGDVYVYTNVAEKTYIDFLAAESKGQFLNSNIKGSFAYQKLNLEKKDISYRIYHSSDILVFA